MLAVQGISIIFNKSFFWASFLFSSLCGIINDIGLMFSTTIRVQGFLPDAREKTRIFIHLFNHRVGNRKAIRAISVHRKCDEKQTSNTMFAWLHPYISTTCMVDFSKVLLHFAQQVILFLVLKHLKWQNVKFQSF